MAYLRGMNQQARSTIHQQFSITYQYPVHFTKHLFNKDNPVLSDFLNIPEDVAGKKILFVLDEGMLSHHPQLPEAIAAYMQAIPALSCIKPFIILPGGEKAKNDPACFEKLAAAIDRCGIDRHSFLAAVGGGAVLDLAGYAAATAHRGIRHIRIPTTVLSQNDSGVGVKNGINYFNKKNFLGTFTPPRAVFNDICFLETLDERNWRSGMAEAVKVALVKDAAFFKWLEDHARRLADRNMEAMEYLVYHCAALHLRHIASGDPFETGSSRPLDFGHWSAHKLEQLSSYTLLHGEAVAIGMALDTLYAEKTGRLNAAAARRIVSLLQKLQFNVYHPLLEEDAVIDGLEEFREHLGGRLTIMLPRDIGKGENVHAMDTGIIRQCIARLKEMSITT